MRDRGFVKTAGMVFLFLFPISFLLYWSVGTTFNRLFGGTQDVCFWVTGAIIWSAMASIWFARANRQYQMIFTYSSAEEFRGHLELVLSRAGYPIVDAAEKQVIYKDRGRLAFLARDIVVTYDVNQAAMTGPAFELKLLKLQARKWQEVELVNG